MLANTKYIKNGHECSMCPFSGDVKITQFAYNEYSHAGSTAIDVATSDGIKTPYYAPATIKCVEINAQYAFTWWQTVNEVYLPDDTIGHATYMFGHDESIDCTVGQVIEQGEQIGNMGAGGTATGVHCHIEVAKGHQSSWIPNSYGVYVLPNASLIEQVCFMDDCNFTNMDMSDSDFHYTSEIAEKPQPTPEPTNGEVLNEIPGDFICEEATFTSNVDELRIRRAPNTNGELTGDWYNAGMSVNYDGYVLRGGYCWISWIGTDGTRRWMAAGELDENNINTNTYGSFK